MTRNVEKKKRDGGTKNNRQTSAWQTHSRTLEESWHFGLHSKNTELDRTVKILHNAPLRCSVGLNRSVGHGWHSWIVDMMIMANERKDFKDSSILKMP